MILVTKLDGSEIAVTVELIKYITSVPDTIITLVNGEKIIVKESTELVVGKVLDYRKMIAKETKEQIIRIEKR